jgi:hypothetical protein
MSASSTTVKAARTPLKLTPVTGEKPLPVIATAVRTTPACGATP